MLSDQRMQPAESTGRPLKAAERHQLRKRSFDATARLYDRFRPGYPEPLFDDLMRLSGIPRGGRILEIGPGTGQATLPLARRGFSITGIELGSSMARLCRKNLHAFPNVEILNTAFEDWSPAPSPESLGRWGLYRIAAESSRPGAVPIFPANETASGSRFDLVLSATAFHWIRARVAFTRCAKLLKPLGSLALVWNFLDTPDNAFYNDLRTLYSRVAPQMHLSKPPEERIERQRKKIVSSGHFGPVTILRYPWQRGYDADSYIGLLKTMSDHAILAPQIKRDVFRAIRKLIDAHGGSFIRPVVAVLFLAPKRGT
jgi:SAM-dependent methyltransferase